MALSFAQIKECIISRELQSRQAVDNFLKIQRDTLDSNTYYSPSIPRSLGYFHPSPIIQLLLVQEFQRLREAADRLSASQRAAQEELEKEMFVFSYCYCEIYQTNRYLADRIISIFSPLYDAGYYSQQRIDQFHFSGLFQKNAQDYLRLSVNNDEYLFKICLEAGANINYKYNFQANFRWYSGTLLANVVSTNQVAIIKRLLLEPNIEINEALLIAVTEKNTGIVSLLLASKAVINPNTANQALFLAIENNSNIETIEQLLAIKNIDVNYSQVVSYNARITILAMAVQVNRVEVMRLLVADNRVEKKAEFGSAIGKENIKAVKLFLEAGYVVDQTSLTKGLFKHNPQLTSLLMQYTGKEYFLANGYTSLMFATITADTEQVKIYINDTDLNSKDPNGSTALMWAVKLGHLDIIELLINAKCDINIQHAKDANRTALMYAANVGNVAIVKLLLNANDVNLDITDSHGHTAIDIAGKTDWSGEIKRGSCLQALQIKKSKPMIEQWTSDIKLYSHSLTEEASKKLSYGNGRKAVYLNNALERALESEDAQISLKVFLNYSKNKQESIDSALKRISSLTFEKTRKEAEYRSFSPLAPTSKRGTIN